jgi:hypothetical protein
MNRMSKGSAPVAAAPRAMSGSAMAVHLDPGVDELVRELARTTRMRTAGRY